MTGTSQDVSPQENSSSDRRPNEAGRGRRRTLLFFAVMLGVAFATAGVTFLLITIFEHKQETRRPYVRLVEVTEVTSDPAPWGVNWPDQFDDYRRTVDTTETEYGGSDAMPESKLEKSPWLRRLYAGYAFSLDYREARGHAYMLFDQEATRRVTERPQTGACLHCHAAVIPTYRRFGLEGEGKTADAETLASDFAWPAVMAGFEKLGAMEYAAAHAELLKTPDGTPEDEEIFPGSTTPTTPPSGSNSENSPLSGHPTVEGDAHPVSCVDCHDPESMRARVTRPGFVAAIAALARSDDPVPHFPSVERWRQGDRKEAYDPNALADRQEMRTFVCAQCHVEYYCGPKETLFYPWERGLKVEQIEATYDEHKFPDGTPFSDFAHGETGAPMYKAQHPEFELWSQGIHARSGVSCVDCHMPYQRRGAAKTTDHWVRSPLLMLDRACQTCHRVSEEELRIRVETIQARTQVQMARAAAAMTDMLDAILEAKAAGASEKELAPIYELQKKGMWRLDFVSSENSKGFHADQEAMRILGESIDYCRQAQGQALRLRAGVAPEIERPEAPVRGITPTDEAPLDPNSKPTDGDAKFDAEA